jgi:hypothetical protein
MQKLIVFGLIFGLLGACKKEEGAPKYTLEGEVLTSFGQPMAAQKVFYTPVEFVLTNTEGRFRIEGLSGPSIITPQAANFTFKPSSNTVNQGSSTLQFTATRVPDSTEVKIFNWFTAQQMPNGLLESSENSNVVSLYDNALAALVFILHGENQRAERIFDFFKSRQKSELEQGVGGFSQFRDKQGNPYGNRWMGENAWLLLALQNYKQLTGNNQYGPLANSLTRWLTGLQDSDGGLFAGYNQNDLRLNYKVTEGNIDAFAAVSGYTPFHAGLLNYLKNNRWDAANESLISWPDNPAYYYALDLHSWGYLIFNNFPESTLSFASRFWTGQTAVNGAMVDGYCFDEDRDVVWLEGTAQMALAFGKAGNTNNKNWFLKELKKALLTSPVNANTAGFSYATNPGTAYGAEPLWPTAHTQIAISSGAWYIMAQFNFNPFAMAQAKPVPLQARFW